VTIPSLGTVILVVALSAAPVSAQEPPRGSDPAVRAMIQTALDDALRNQVEHLFAIWMKDDKGQPQRASAGIRRAVAAYRHAIRAIETERLTWAGPSRGRTMPK
jgi:hypothetical protein